MLRAYILIAFILCLGLMGGFIIKNALVENNQENFENWCITNDIGEIKIKEGKRQFFLKEIVVNNWAKAQRVIDRAANRGWSFNLSGKHEDVLYRCTFKKENDEVTEEANTPEEAVIKCEKRLK